MLKLFEPILVDEKFRRIPKMIIAPFCSQIGKGIGCCEDILNSEWFESAKQSSFELVKSNQTKNYQIADTIIIYGSPIASRIDGNILIDQLCKQLNTQERKTFNQEKFDLISNLAKVKF